MRFDKKGRASPPTVRILHAEDAACPAANPLLPGPQTHRLTNDRDATTFCMWCGLTWVDIDALIRESHPETTRRSAYDVS